MKTYTATIYIAGDYQQILSTCRKFTIIGACVSVQQCDYVYTGGMESGAAITLIKYPRFPDSAESIFAEAKHLAVKLMKDCCQRSCSIVATDKTEYLENKEIKVPR